MQRRMATERIPITVCPNSNILIANRYARLEDHPFSEMRDAGLLATINTDDPAMTDLDLGREYRSVARALGLDFEAMAAVSLDGIAASWLDDADRRTMRADFERTIAGLRPSA
jgi:adenosine deaminase